jgi:hypothetical protein
MDALAQPQSNCTARASSASTTSAPARRPRHPDASVTTTASAPLVFATSTRGNAKRVTATPIVRDSMPGRPALPRAPLLRAASRPATSRISPISISRPSSPSLLLCAENHSDPKPAPNGLPRTKLLKQAKKNLLLCRIRTNKASHASVQPSICTSSRKFVRSNSASVLVLLFPTELLALWARQYLSVFLCSRCVWGDPSHPALLSIIAQHTRLNI